jgi:cob(I)alamin adenosyltransferase
VPQSKARAVHRKLERRIVALLNDEPESGIKKTAAKSKAGNGD